MMDSNLDKEKMEETVDTAVETESLEETTEESAGNTEETEINENEKTEEETLEEKLVKAEEQVKEAQDKWLRQLAEFENFRKRTNQEKQGMYNNGVRDTIEKFLPVVDNFERAVAATEDKESSTYKGIEMILKQMLEVMKALGVEEIPAEGEPFDPNVHAAVMHIEDEGCDENVVVEVFQKGYKHGDKVIRPAMVKVAN
ncbi:MAG: nucleotide exchange factor GrpE [Clostridia bacterium]|nr:nucleotide exchange factor GrpE [Clostridia bacterium]